jgi:hypothetical protein
LAFYKALFRSLLSFALALSSKSRCTSSSNSLKFSSSDFSFFSSIGLIDEVYLWSVSGLLLNPALALDFMAVPSLY